MNDEDQTIEELARIRGLAVSREDVGWSVLKNGEQIKFFFKRDKLLSFLRSNVDKEAQSIGTQIHPEPNAARPPLSGEVSVVSRVVRKEPSNINYLGQGDHVLKSYFSFKGRIRRRTYLAVIIPLFIVGAALYIANIAVASNVVGGDFISNLVPFILPVYVLCLWVALVTHIKRFHDLDMTGWWTLTLVIPFGNILISLLLCIPRGKDGPNRYGADPLNPDFISAHKEYSDFSEVKNGFQTSVEYLKENKPKEALSNLKELLESKFISDKDKGAIHFNIAVCYRRLGEDLQAANTLKLAFKYAPKLAKQARKDVDLADLFNNKEFSPISNGG